jgi:hypothetical protein
MIEESFKIHPMTPSEMDELRESLEKSRQLVEASQHKSQFPRAAPLLRCGRSGRRHLRRDFG